MDYLELTAVVLATGAVGTAAFGIVDVLKGTRLGMVGFGHIAATLGEDVMRAIERAYGTAFGKQLESLYRQDRSVGGLTRGLRQGVRIGLHAANAARLAEVLGVVDPRELQRVAEKLARGEPLLDSDRSVLGRFELAMDARIDAAVALADDAYRRRMQLAASLVAISLAFLGAATLDGGIGVNWTRALLVGVAAVPIAPIAKDIAASIKSSRTALGRPS